MTPYASGATPLTAQFRELDFFLRRRPPRERHRSWTRYAKRRGEPDYRDVTRDVERILARFHQQPMDGGVLDL